MKVKYRYTFRNNKDNCLIMEFLDKYHIKYKITSGIPITIVEVFEHEDYWEQLERLMEEHGSSPLIEKVFSKSEIINAEWLRIRSNWRWEYPQPEGGFAYTGTTYDNHNYCSECGFGLKQKEEFRIKKRPNWGNRNFLMLNWIEDELFVTNKVVEEFKMNNINGITSLPVKKIRSDEEIDNIKQLKINTILEKGLIIDSAEVLEMIICGRCKQIKYILKGKQQLKFKKELFENKPDILKTYEVFGGGLIAARKIIVSNRVADIIIRNNWVNNAVLEPVELV